MNVTAQNLAGTKAPPIPTLPNIIIIGAMKAGTGSLHYYLSKHPEIFMSKIKELNFFDREESPRRDLNWYKAQFDANYRFNGESSPQYTRFPRNPGVVERIKETIPNPKLIYLLRDPVDRIVSHYIEMLTRWRETRSFDAMLADIENERHQYIECSSYHLQLSQYWKHFSPDDIHVVILERLSKDPKAELKRVFRFIGVDENFWSPDFDVRKNEGENKRVPRAFFTAITPRFIRRQTFDVTWMPWSVAKMLNQLVRIGAPPPSKPNLGEKDDLRLQAILKDDVAALRAFLKDPLPEWRPYA